MTVYAYQGELVTCKSGHPIAILNEDILINDHVVAEKFSGWFQHQGNIPLNGLAIDPCCPTCGSHWIQLSGPNAAMKLHVGDDWR